VIEAIASSRENVDYNYCQGLDVLEGCWLAECGFPLFPSSLSSLLALTVVTMLVDLCLVLHIGLGAHITSEAQV
jgi:hypothetical protein